MESLRRNLPRGQTVLRLFDQVHLHLPHQALQAREHAAPLVQIHGQKTLDLATSEVSVDVYVFHFSTLCISTCYNVCNQRLTVYQDTKYTVQFSVGAVVTSLITACSCPYVTPYNPHSIAISPLVTLGQPDANCSVHRSRNLSREPAPTYVVWALPT